MKTKRKTTKPARERTKNEATEVSRRGRPPAEDGTSRGVSRLRFDVPDDVARQVREKHAEAYAATGVEINRFLAVTLCKGLGITLPPPKKRGPKTGA